MSEIKQYIIIGKFPDNIWHFIKPHQIAEYTICKSEQPCFIFNTISEAEEFLLKLPIGENFGILEINMEIE